MVIKMISKMVIQTPAKINLFLEIIGVLETGYHSLQTIMQEISLCDEITLEKNSSGMITVTSSDISIPTDEGNIVYKATEEFLRYIGKEISGLHIHIVKNIPHQAGLGGGSSNAAGVLVALNQMMEANLSDNQLCEIAVHLGADVPFFISGGLALAEGIGERLTPIPMLGECIILVSKGENGISTADAYRRFDEIFDYTPHDVNLCLDYLKQEDIKEKFSSNYNCFEQIANLPEVDEQLELMRENGAVACNLSGSGSAVFGVFKDEKIARECEKILSSRGYFTSLCKTTSQGNRVVLAE